MKINTATYKNVLIHLSNCDKQFVPPLSQRVNIEEYSRKISVNAILFEAWNDKKLIGLVAMYIDDKKEGFVTSVSVIKGYLGRGIASSVFNNLIKYSLEADLIKIKLEVSKFNYSAIRLYKKFGFEAINELNDQIIMCKKLNKHEN